MATSKQPPFPTPALEWGVPQYPTPNVPDFSTKDGHIILVEKVSAEKGSYNPQPLDGSVTYSKRDANKWPTDLYLVYQRPDDTGAFVYNYYANDRTLASQDPWNFGLDYSANNPDFPITSRTYIVPRDQYETVALGSTDPVFGGDQIIAAQKKVELPDDNPLRSRYVGVQRVYETIPGPVIEGVRVTERGDTETITQQTVVAGTAPDADSLLVTQTSVQPVDSVKSTKTKGSVESYATLTTKSKRAGLLGEVSISDDIVGPATVPDALSLSVVDSSVEAISATKSRKRTTTSTGPTLLNGKSIGEFGYITSEESIVAYGSVFPTPTKDTVDLKKEPIDQAKAKLTKSVYESPEVLNGYQYDADLGLIVENTKEIIIEGNSPVSITNGLLAYTDTPINAWQSIRIQSKITSLPQTRTEYKTGSYASPNLLTGFDNSFFAFPDGTVNYNVIPILKSRRSYQTSFKYETSFSYGQPSPPSVTLFDPVPIGVVYLGFFFKFDLGDCLTNSGLSVTFSTGLNTATSAKYGYLSEIYTVPTSTVTASAYIALAGTYQIISYDIEYWKANIWKTSIASVLLK
jgi:hypothetical protein